MLGQKTAPVRSRIAGRRDHRTGGTFICPGDHGIDEHRRPRYAVFFATSWGLTMAKIGKAITRVDLYDAVYQNVGLSRTESSALVELVLKAITDCLEKGETVKLSSFGSFTVRKKGERIGRNPKTGMEAPISPRRVVVFKASAVLKQRINRRDAGSSDAVAVSKARSSAVAG
jgi:integration host factor subunit alpha